ncbi:MAG: large-conductance mechanosensitive channel [Firmicutes bacterium]|nr:large-conductance mechanosensitive channel [Bacillota bacterium]
MLKEFKEFAMRGNVLDLAVGIIIGAAFSKIVSSLVNDILLPLVGLLLGRIDFSNLFINLSEIKYTTIAMAKNAGAPTLNYGLFINSIVDFLLVAIAIFFLVKSINKLKRTQPTAPTEKICPFCFSKINIMATKCAFCASDIDK